MKRRIRRVPESAVRTMHPEVEAVDVMLRIAAGKPDEKELSGWLKANSTSPVASAANILKQEDR